MPISLIAPTMIAIILIGAIEIWNAVGKETNL